MVDANGVKNVVVDVNGVKNAVRSHHRIIVRQAEATNVEGGVMV